MHHPTQAKCLIYASKGAFVAEIVRKFLELTKLPTDDRTNLIVGGKSLKIDQQRIESFGLSPHSTVEVRFEQLLGGSLLANKVIDQSKVAETGKPASSALENIEEAKREPDEPVIEKTDANGACEPMRQKLIERLAEPAVLSHELPESWFYYAGKLT